MAAGRRPILIVKTGSTFPELAAGRGDYEDWIREGLGAEAAPVEVVHVEAGEPLPSAREVRGALVTGSAAFVTDRNAWSERTGAWLAELVELGTPLLAICYGHQLLAQATGGRVARNPRGREIGTVEISLRPEARREALFAELPARFPMQLTHVESVVELPPGARWLASSAGDPHQAFALGECAIGVQFHPEIDASAMRFYLEQRRGILLDEGLDPDALLAQVAESPMGPALLARFAALAAQG